MTYSEIDDVRGILEELGYVLTNDGAFYRARPIYRNSNNSTSLRIHKESGRFIDFSINKGGSYSIFLIRNLILRV
jgi:hypothetical protein